MKLIQLVLVTLFSFAFSTCPISYTVDNRVLSAVVHPSYFGLSPTFQNYEKWISAQDSLVKKSSVINMTLTNADTCDPFFYKAALNGGQNGLNTTSGYTISSAALFNYIGSGSISIASNDRVYIFIDSMLVESWYDSHNELDLDSLRLIPEISYRLDIVFTGNHSLELSNISVTTNMGLGCPFYDHCGVCMGEGLSCCNCTAPDLCHTATCTRDGCVIQPVLYSPPDMCHTVTCNPSTGKNITKKITCEAVDKCQKAFCDPLAGCIYSAVNCDDGNPCTVDACYPSVGCLHSPIHNCRCENVQCSQNLKDWCRPNVCDINSGTCVQVKTSCNDDNPFTIDYCNGILNMCDYGRLNCDDGNLCTTDGYDVKTGKCSHKNVTCDDGNRCTNDYCDPVLGCVHIPVPLPQNDLCNYYVCDSKAGIIALSTTCPKACSICDPLRGCVNCTTIPFTAASEDTHSNTSRTTAAIGSWFKQNWILEAVIGGSLLALIIVVLLIVLFVRRRGQKPKPPLIH